MYIALFFTLAFSMSGFAADLKVKATKAKFSQETLDSCMKTLGGSQSNDLFYSGCNSSFRPQFMTCVIEMRTNCPDNTVLAAGCRDMTRSRFMSCVKGLSSKLGDEAPAKRCLAIEAKCVDRDYPPRPSEKPVSSKVR